MKALWILLLFSLINFFCRDSSIVYKKIKQGEYFIEGRIIDDSIPDGVVKVFDSRGTLIATHTYKHGIKDGVALNYYSSGKLKDSFYYRNGHENGGYFGFDPKGNIKNFSNYYFGLQIGGGVKFTRGEPKSFQFFDLERKFDVFSCEYDSTGNVVRATEINPHLTISHMLIDDTERLGFFSYLPRPLLMKSEYKLGLKNTTSNETKNVVILDSGMPFIDTLLSYPDTGWYYFMSVHLKDSGTYNKLKIFEFRE